MALEISLLGSLKERSVVLVRLEVGRFARVVGRILRELHLNGRCLKSSHVLLAGKDGLQVRPFTSYRIARST